MGANDWYILLGCILILMGLVSSIVKRLPLTTSLLYLILGVSLGPHGLKLFYLDPLQHTALLERVTEVVVIISLFGAGLKLRLPWQDFKWRMAIGLALISMIFTVGLICLYGVFILHWPVGPSVILGAVLAPTDPVLASDVQVQSPDDQDQLRFSLTGEAGLNDGTSFPFIMLGLGLLGHHELGPYGLKWLLWDVIWAIAGGLLVGFFLGTGLSYLVISLRRKKKETGMLDDFLALGLILLSYGLALLLKSYGFLAVFAAGASLRRTERRLTKTAASKQVKELAALGRQDEIAPSYHDAPAYTAQAVLFFNEQLERLGEVGLVLLLGCMISFSLTDLKYVSFVIVLFLVIRPISTWVTLRRTHLTQHQKWLIGWFGVKGIGSLYYLMFAVQNGFQNEFTSKLVVITLLVVSVSIMAHGASVTPLMVFYSRRSRSPKSSLHLQ